MGREGGARDGRTGNEERTVGMKEAWIFSRFERAKRWGSICRKIDWTGVTFALVSRGYPRQEGRNERREILQKNSTRILSIGEAKSQKNARQSDSFFFFWKTFVRIVNRKILLRN